MKNIFIVITIFLTGFCVHAQQTGSVFWEISGNGLEKPSYLFGTMHLICPGDYSMPDKVKEAFSLSEQVYLEVDMDDPSFMAKMQQHASMTGDSTIKDYLSTEEYNLLDNHLKSKMGMGLDFMQDFNPITILSMVLVTLIPCQPVSYETEFVKMNMGSGKEILGLETPEFQMSVFDSIPYKYQFELLVDMVKRQEEATSEFEEMVLVYKSGDIEGLLQIMDDSEWNYEKFNDLLINNRNKNWIPIIEGQIKLKPTFFAFGAGHLPGEEGVVRLLREKGYTVEAILMTQQ